MKIQFPDTAASRDSEEFESSYSDEAVALMELKILAGSIKWNTLGFGCEGRVTRNRSSNSSAVYRGAQRSMSGNFDQPAGVAVVVSCSRSTWKISTDASSPSVIIILSNLAGSHWCNTSRPSRSVFFSRGSPPLRPLVFAELARAPVPRNNFGSREITACNE